MKKLFEDLFNGIDVTLSTLVGGAFIVAAVVMCFNAGCSSTPPTAFEQKIFDIKTNYFPVVVVQTNLVTVTNTLVETVIRTNTVGVMVPQFVTNMVTVQVPTVQTQIVQQPAYTYSPGAGAEAAKGVASTIGNLAAPGVGGPIAGGIASLIFAGWAWIRGNKKDATANNLAQTIEVAREILQSLPNGAAYNATFTQWMQQHQAEAGVLPQVLNILANTVDNPQAQQVAAQLQAAVAAIQNPAPPAPTPPPVPTAMTTHA